MGMLAYRVYTQLKAWINTGVSRLKFWHYLVGVAVIAYALTVQLEITGLLKLFYGDIPGLLMAHGLFALSLSVIFLCFKNQGLDRFVGELSYPVYLIHPIIITTLKPLVDWRRLGPLTAIISIVLSILLYQFCFRRIDEKRHAAANEVAGTGQLATQSS
jgi:peptidoglycan/LPS O-acetylase OafA/YrhL